MADWNQNGDWFHRIICLAVVILTAAGLLLFWAGCYAWVKHNNPVLIQVPRDN
jgi:hypothetical protein